MKYRCCATLVLWGLGRSLHAQDLDLHAYADERLVSAPADTSWTRGGFGKTRYGGGQTQVHMGGAAVYGALQITPELLALGQLQYQTSGHSGFNLLEGWLRYRPVSITAWRWSVKAGVFFPPVSMENDGVGWTSPWTLSSSAINTWTGEELRAVGGEFALEHRGEVHSWDLRAALFRRDDPAGTVLAARAGPSATWLPVSAAVCVKPMPKSAMREARRRATTILSAASAIHTGAIMWLSVGMRRAKRASA